MKNIIKLCYQLVDTHGKFINREDTKEAYRLAVAGAEYSHEHKIYLTMAYVDPGYISIVRCINNKAIAVRIYGEFTSAPKFGNPALMIDGNGEVVRLHGELYNAEEYLESLI